MTSPPGLAPTALLPGAGEMARRMRAFNWSATGIGPVERWPHSLRNSVSICLECAFPFVVWWGPDFITFYNDAFQALLGVKHPRALAEPAREVWPELWNVMGAKLTQVMREGQSTRSPDVLLTVGQNGDSEECYFSFSCTPIYGETGEVGGVSCAVIDTTEKVIGERRASGEAEQRATRIVERVVTEQTRQLESTTRCLRLSERMASLGTLSAGLGHDLGNLLLPLDVRLQLLLQADLPSELREHVIGIQTCTQYLQRISNGLRLLAVDPSGTLDAGETELGDWWEDVRMILTNVVPDAARLEHDFPTSECWVGVGPVVLTQVVFNLMQNAAESLKARCDGVVTLLAEHDPLVGKVQMTISDNGTGMNDEVLRRCMDPYFTTKVRGASTGMGLSIVHALVTAAGGSVEIDSRVGVGTSVKLIFPAA